MNRRLRLFAVLLAAGCGTADLDLGRTSEADEIASVTNLLESRIQAEFGPAAKIQSVFGTGEKIALGIATQTEDQVEDSDVVSPLAIASFDRRTLALSVVSSQASYREARLLGNAAALVTADGKLEVREADGTSKIVAAGLRGDVVPSFDGKTLALTLAGESMLDGETAVAITDLSGNLKVVADSEGVDDRPALSPDGQTVVFVSGRSGMASLWRTDLAGAAAVQLTNKDLVVDTDSDLEQAPPGFVPPPVTGDRVEWVSKDVVRYDAGGGEYWQVSVRSGQATREGGVQ